MSILRLLDQLGDAAFLVDADGVILEANETAVSRAGRLSAALVDSSLWELVRAERLSQRKFVLAEVLATGRSARFVDRVDGRWTEVFMGPADAIAGEGTSVVVVHRDVHERVSAEEELKRLRLRVMTIQEDERRTISQELHDELGQGMTALLIRVRGLSEADDGPELDRRVRDVVALVGDLTKRMRQLFYRVRPPALQSTPLLQAMRDYCSAFAETSGLQIDLDANEPLPPLEDASSTALYRLLQECLNNVAKHAGAHSAWVTVGVEDGRVSVSIEDDGVGFDALRASTGLSIGGLRERFRMLEGEVEVESQLGTGTRVSGSVPMGIRLEAGR